MKYIILAAGSGTRLWPFSRHLLPKQFLHFGDHETLLQKSVKRFYPHVPAQDILVITHQSYFHLVKNQLKAIDPCLEKQILLEPEKRSTAPAICLALKYFEQMGSIAEDECFLICPSDHLMDAESSFLSLVKEGETVAKSGYHVLFGVKPTYPETGYGYIHASSTVKGPGYLVDCFKEKPDASTAEIYLASGEYFWNSGIFLFHLPTFKKDLEEVSPSFSSLFSRSFQDLHAHFSELPSTSIDYALIEKSEKNVMIPLMSKWSDVGSWDSVYELFDKDANQNVKIGNVVDLDSQGCLIMGNKRLISTVGLEDLIVIETDDAVFIGKKGQSQRVKTLVEELKKMNLKESSEHLTSQRPWGSYTVLEEGLRYKIKRIVVDPGQRLSLQLHYHRSEHWVVVRGTAKVTLDQEEKLVHENESIYVEKSQVHRLENPGKVPLELIEVQVGEYVGEDDIIRLEDIYQRV